MLIGLGTGSAGTAELARRLDLPHERHWLPWECDPVRLDAALPEIETAGGEVGLYLLPYVESILARHPETRFVCMQRDPTRTAAGLARKLGSNPFAIPEDAARFHHGFPWYGSDGVMLDEACARFYREYYALAYDLQRRHPASFRVVFTDHLLSDPRATERWQALCDLTQREIEAFLAADRIERAA